LYDDHRCWKYYRKSVHPVLPRVGGRLSETRRKGTHVARILTGTVGVALVLLFAVLGCAKNMQGAETTIITGTIRVVGNEPFSRVVLTVGENPDMATRDQDYLIVGPLAEELRRNFQWKKLTLEGTPCSLSDPAFKKCFNPSRIVGRSNGVTGK